MTMMNKNKSNADIFDRLFGLPIFSVFEPFYKKHKEVLLYLLFGGLTTIISILTFRYFNIGLGINELVANIFSWIISVLFAFITNRIWVFKSNTDTLLKLFKQALSFYSGRIATLLIEEAILWIFITKLSLGSMAVKISAQIIVILLNYIISKKIIFKENR